MTYRADNKIRKYVQGYGFLSFAKKVFNQIRQKACKQRNFSI